MIKKALILAGGLGTRLRPLTDTTPKPLLPIKGKPIIQHLIENLQKHGVEEVILSIGYRADKIKEYFDDLNLDIKITYSLETEPLGTGGAVVKANLQEPFILAWGDNLMDLDVQQIVQEFQENDSQITMVLTPREDVEHFGVAKLNNDKIINFVEKPKREDAPSNLINAGAFVVDPKCLDILPSGKSSIEKDCFEKLAPLGKISAFIHEGQWFPTDTLEKYNFAEANFEC